MQKWKFGINNSYLIDLVLSGKKTATTSIYNGEVPTIGEISRLVYDNNECACKVRTMAVFITEFKNITWDMAKLEGENGSLETWQNEHRNYFRRIDPSFNDDTKVVFEIFQVIS